MKRGRSVVALVGGCAESLLRERGGGRMKRGRSVVALVGGCAESLLRERDAAS